MGGKVIFIIEFGGAENPKTVGKDIGFAGIAEMPIKVLLLDFSICSSVCWYGTTGSLIWIIEFIKSIIFSPSF